MLHCKKLRRLKTGGGWGPVGSGCGWLPARFRAVADGRWVLRSSGFGVVAVVVVDYGVLDQLVAVQFTGDFGSRKNRLPDPRAGAEKGLGLVGPALGLG